MGEIRHSPEGDDQFFVLTVGVDRTYFEGVESLFALLHQHGCSTLGHRRFVLVFRESFLFEHGSDRSIVDRRRKSVNRSILLQVKIVQWMSLRLGTDLDGKDVDCFDGFLFLIEVDLSESDVGSEAIDPRFHGNLAKRHESFSDDTARSSEDQFAIAQTVLLISRRLINGRQWDTQTSIVLLPTRRTLSFMESLPHRHTWFHRVDQ